METIDQLAAVLSLGVTFIAGSAMFVRTWLRASHPKEIAAGSEGGFFRATVVTGAICGSVGLALLIWLVGASGLGQHHHHFAPFVWFIAFLANLALAVGIALVGTMLLTRIGTPRSAQ